MGTAVRAASRWRLAGARSRVCRPRGCPWYRKRPRGGPVTARGHRWGRGHLPGVGRAVAMDEPESRSVRRTPLAQKDPATAAGEGVARGRPLGTKVAGRPFAKVRVKGDPLSARCYTPPSIRPLLPVLPEPAHRAHADRPGRLAQGEVGVAERCRHLGPTAPDIGPRGGRRAAQVLALWASALHAGALRERRGRADGGPRARERGRASRRRRQRRRGSRRTRPPALSPDASL